MNLGRSQSRRPQAHNRPPLSQPIQPSLRTRCLARFSSGIETQRHQNIAKFNPVARTRISTSPAPAAERSASSIASPSKRPGLILVQAQFGAWQDEVFSSAPASLRSGRAIAQTDLAFIATGGISFRSASRLGSSASPGRSRSEHLSSDVPASPCVPAPIEAIATNAGGCASLGKCCLPV